MAAGQQIILQSAKQTKTCTLSIQHNNNSRFFSFASPGVITGE